MGRYTPKGMFADTGRDDQDGLRRLVDRLVKDADDLDAEARAERARADAEERAAARRLFGVQDDGTKERGTDDRQDVGQDDRPDVGQDDDKQGGAA